MENGVAKACKVTAIIIFVFCFIGSIIMGVVNKNFFVFLGCLLGCFLFCLILYALGEIVQQLSDVNENAASVMKIMTAETDRNSPAAQPSPPIPKNAGREWTCPKCGTHNGSTVRCCKNCGEYK